MKNINKNPEVSIAIPIYNEEVCIKETVTNLANEFEKHNVDYEIVLVNHGSSDNTDKVLAILAAKNKRLKVHNLPKNLGYGGGIMYGFENSKGDYIGFTCADEEVSSSDVYNVFDALKKSNYDVSKSRRIERKDGKFRKLTSFIFNNGIKLRFSLGLKDVNGYPMFMKRELFPPVKTKEISYLFNLDFLRNMKKIGYTIVEIPVVHHERKKGKSFMKLFRIINMGLGFFWYSIKPLPKN